MQQGHLPPNNHNHFWNGADQSASSYQGEWNREYTCVHMYTANMDAEWMQSACVLGADCRVNA